MLRLKRVVAHSVALVSLASLDAAAPARPVKLDKGAADAVVQEIEKDRADTQKWLKSDATSYLATVDRRDFGDKPTLTVGRAVDNDLRLDDLDVAAHHVRVTVKGDAFEVRAVDDGASFKSGGEQKRSAIVDPSSIQIARFTLRLSHQRFPAIIVFDPQSPRFNDYKGLKYFPVDLAYRYELPLTRRSKPERTVIMSTLGHQRRAERVGWFEFMVGDTRCRLEAVRLLEPGVGENDIGLFFRDATTGAETYALGRYVDAKLLPNGNYVLDFNLAYNPACAFSDHYNCPIPPPANTLGVAIRAGEMDSDYH